MLRWHLRICVLAVGECWDAVGHAQRGGCQLFSERRQDVDRFVAYLQERGCRVGFRRALSGDLLGYKLARAGDVSAGDPGVLQRQVCELCLRGRWPERR